MFTNTQIEAAVEALSTPFNYPELEALRKVALWSLLHQRVQAAPGNPRRTRRCSAETVEKIEDVLTSNEPPAVLVQRHGYSVQTIHAIKAGYAAYKRFGGSPEFWRTYRRQYREDLARLH